MHVYERIAPCPTDRASKGVVGAAGGAGGAGGAAPGRMADILAIVVGNTQQCGRMAWHGIAWRGLEGLLRSDRVCVCVCVPWRAPHCVAKPLLSRRVTWSRLAGPISAWSRRSRGRRVECAAHGGPLLSGRSICSGERVAKPARRSAAAEHPRKWRTAPRQLRRYGAAESGLAAGTAAAGTAGTATTNT